MKDLKLTAVIIEAEEGGYLGYLEELKEVISQGETIAEVEENLQDALAMYLESDDSDTIEGKIPVVRKPFMNLLRAVS